MQKKFYQDNKLKYHNFKFPKDRNQDLTEIVKDQPIPQADTVVLYSCGTLANKGRKRYKHKGQTSSIYMSESLGGKQVGTLVNTLATKKGPVFYDSIPNSKAETVNPIVFKYIPVHNPIFTDMGYSLPSWNHRKINHSRKSSDKRNKWSRQRWSKNGIHSQVAEGRNSILKRSFASYVWINPTYSTLYLNEYSFLANLNHFALDDLLPSESRKIEKPDYQMDDNWALRGFARDNMHEQKQRLSENLSSYRFDAKALPEIIKAEHKDKLQAVHEQIQSLENEELKEGLTTEFESYRAWRNAKPTVDQRKKQRYYETIAEKLWYAIPEKSYIEIHDLAHKFKISGKHVFRLFGVWTRLGLLDSIDLNRVNNGRRIEYFDIRRTCKPLIPMRYVFPKDQIPQFNKEWRSKLRRIS